MVAGLSRRERTRQRILDVALELFERDGYEATGTARIAAAAGVSEMTFFRHFPAKERLLIDDPYDPVMAAAVAAQPAELAALARIVAGIGAAWRALPVSGVALVRRRLRIAARTPSLLGPMRASTRATEEALVDSLVTTGADPRAARIAAAAALAALTTALTDWAATDECALDDAVRCALDVLAGGGL